MAAQYYPVTLTEIDTFLMAYSNGKAKREGVAGSEWYYMLDITDILSVTVWTGISVQSTVSRPVGTDAIRVVLWGRVGCTTQYKPICKAKRVHRVQGWQANLQRRLDSIVQLATPVCPQCSGSTIERVNRQSLEVFYGCLAYPVCKGTVPHREDKYAAQT